MASALAFDLVASGAQGVQCSDFGARSKAIQGAGIGPVVARGPQPSATPRKPHACSPGASGRLRLVAHCRPARLFGKSPLG
jgi:hypothetical protein